MTSKKLRLISTIVILAEVTIFASFSHAKPLSLDEAFRESVTKTERVKIQESVKEQADEQVTQLWGAIFPRINALGSYQRQQAAVGTTAFSNPDQYSLRLNLTQPIFRGLSEFAEIRRGKLRLNAEEKRIKAEGLLLYADVAQAFYRVLSAEKDLANLRALIELTDKRTKDLSARARIGKTRRGELLAAETQLAILLAQSESAELERAQARENWTLVSGLPQNSELTEPDSLPAKPPSLDDATKQVEARPDIEAAKLLTEAADESVSSAWGQHLPTIDFSGNYYLARTGVLANTKWDIGLTVSIPLFAGGALQSEVREAREVHKAATLTLQRSRRQALEDIRETHATLERSLAQVAALTKALSTAEENYRVQNQDYRYGLVNNLDVISAMNTLQETRRVLDKTRYQAWNAWAAFRASTGSLP